MFLVLYPYISRLFSPAKGLKTQGPNFGCKSEERDQGGLILALLLEL